MGRRRAIAGLAPILAALAVTPAAHAVVQCAPRPDDPVGYEVSLVGADTVQAPATTPPIAVLDSGVAVVPELDGRLREGLDVTTGGRNTNDVDGHGTAVASVAAAAAGGVRGISPTSPVIPIKIFDNRGETTAKWVIDAIRAAIDRGAGVINISAAGPADGVNRAADRAVRKAVFEAVTKGILVVTPTGNEGASALDIPAAYPHVLAVGATDRSGDPASFSNSGPGIDLVAAGESITVAAPGFMCGSGFALVSGTSFAAPAVAGAAALLMQARPGLQPGQLIDMLRLGGAFGTPPPWSAALGFGLLDVPAALAAPVPPADAPEVDDTVAWARRHPAVLTAAKRSSAVEARVAAKSDPADVFRLVLRRGDRVSARLSSVAGDAKLVLELRSARRRIARARTTRVTATIRRSGTYYARVAARRTAPAGSGYELRLTRRPKRR